MIPEICFLSGKGRIVRKPSIQRKGRKRKKNKGRSKYQQKN